LQISFLSSLILNLGGGGAINSSFACVGGLLGGGRAHGGGSFTGMENFILNFGKVTWVKQVFLGDFEQEAF